MERFLPSGLQAVVLAGGQGSRMTELTAGKPKCLLPIGNKPMIWYPLNTLEKSGFLEAIVIVSEAIEVIVLAAIEKLNLKIKVEIIGIPQIENIGTAESIRFIHEKIKLDVIFISADFIADINLNKTIQLFYKYNATVTTLFLKYPEVPSSFVTPGLKNHDNCVRDLIFIEENGHRLVYFSPAVDFKKPLKMNTFNKLLQKYSNVKSYSKLLDSHTYIMKKWVIDFLVNSRNLSTIRGDLIPYLVKKQLSKQKSILDDKNVSIVNVDMHRDIFYYAKDDPYDSLIRKMSSYDDPYLEDIIRCNAHINTQVNALRANTITLYSYANAVVNNWYNFQEKNVAQTLISSNTDIKSTQLTNTTIDENSFILEKTSLSDSHLSNNVTVKSKTRIKKSVIMNNVIVKERCIIENSIICNGCVIEEESKLVNCVVAAHVTVPSNSSHNHENLGNHAGSNWFTDDEQ